MKLQLIEGGKTDYLKTVTNMINNMIIRIILIDLGGMVPGAELSGFGAFPVVIIQHNHHTGKCHSELSS